MKIIAFYLPQFHNIPENDEWWGDGFTEWTNVRKAKPYFEGHNQPEIPLNQNYYNLLDDNVKLWQAKLAKEYGVYGFCYYHYWFNGKMLLEKPMEQMLKNKEINQHFCICWANEPWTKAWVNETKVLIPQKYGHEKEWKEHFDYLLPFFKDDRYIKHGGRPLMVIYRPQVIDCIREMISYWNKLAKEAGFKDGLCFAYQTYGMEEKGDDMFDYSIEFQPAYAGVFQKVNVNQKVTVHSILSSIRIKTTTKIERMTGINLEAKFDMYRKKKMGVGKVSYDLRWKVILDHKPENEKKWPGAFTSWDNTPRHHERGICYVGSTPEKFKNYLSQLIRKTKEEYHADMIFVNAWNEWAEGAHLEPDERNKYGYLEAVRDALKENNEWPVE